MSILSRESICERASIDEAYLDITEASARRVAAAAAAGGLPDPGHDLSAWHLAGQVRFYFALTAAVVGLPYLNFRHWYVYHFAF
jgi:nucleotidyltransferase/DNA polymerase involved in DNA repair